MRTLEARNKREDDEKALIREFFNNKKHGVYVEVGANDPSHVSSQSWHLENRLNWGGVLVEPNPQLAQVCREKRANAKVYECACVAPEDEGRDIQLHIPIENGVEKVGHSSVEKNADDFSYKEHKSIRVQSLSLDSILEDSEISDIDILSIDVEGTELEVLKGFSIEKYHPALILLEDKHLYLTKHRYLKQRNYQLVKRTCLNCWYIPKGTTAPPQTLLEKFKILKRMYLSIWLKKIKFSIKNRTFRPFTEL
jgi:FkbM family methyltransferase